MAEWTTSEARASNAYPQEACWRCGASANVLACTACGAPQAGVADLDRFAVLGLPRRLTVDRVDLERRYLDASRAVHPDRHQTADERTRMLSLAASAAVNQAYRTLRDPVALGRYWLELHDLPLGKDNNRVPPALAELVFDTQEALEDFRGGRASRDDVAATHAALDGRLQGLVDDLAAHYPVWDAADPTAPAVLDELKMRLSEVAYLDTLVEDVDEALGV
jgi:molecular chaperone HscB